MPRLLLTFIDYFVVAPFFKVTTRGLENLRKVPGPAVFVCNHQSAVDAFVFGAFDVNFKVTFKNGEAASVLARTLGAARRFLCRAKVLPGRRICDAAGRSHSHQAWRQGVGPPVSCAASASTTAAGVHATYTPVQGAGPVRRVPARRRVGAFLPRGHTHAQRREHKPHGPLQGRRVQARQGLR